MIKMSEEAKKLKRVLDLKLLTLVFIGQIIGGGFFLSTPAAMAAGAGGGVWIAYLLAYIITLILVIPLAVIGSVIPMPGAFYRVPARLISPYLGFIFILIFDTAALIGMAPLETVGAAKYLQAIIPGLPTIPTAVGIASFFFITNLLGLGMAAWIQLILVLIMLFALLIFGFLGLAHVNIPNMLPFFPYGIGGLLVGTFVLFYAVIGAGAIIELGGEIKNPKRNIPYGILISTTLVILVYILCSVVAAGVVPWSETAEAGTFAVAATAFLSTPLRLFFLIGGAFLAISTTLNSSIMWLPKSWLMMAEDEVIPKWLASVSERFGTPYKLLIIMWFAVVIDIILTAKWSLVSFAEISAVGALAINIPLLIVAIQLRKRIPNLYDKADFNLRTSLLYIISSVGIGVIVIGILILMLKSPMESNVALGMIFLLGTIYYIARKYYLAKKNVVLAADVETLKKEYE